MADTRPDDLWMSLDAPSRSALRDRIHARLPVQADGSIPLVAGGVGDQEPRTGVIR
jgi:hypothetical protein